jgi:hypothetical protein
MKRIPRECKKQYDAYYSHIRSWHKYVRKVRKGTIEDKRTKID